MSRSNRVMLWVIFATYVVNVGIWIFVGTRSMLRGAPIGHIFSQFMCAAMWSLNVYMNIRAIRDERRREKRKRLLDETLMSIRDIRPH